MSGAPGMKDPFLRTSNLAKALHHTAIRSNWLNQDIQSAERLYVQLGNEQWIKTYNSK